MDYGTLQSRLLSRLNMGTNDPIAPLVDELINEALHYVESANPSGWAWLKGRGTFTTTSGTSAYPFSTIAAAIGGGISIMRVEDLRLLSGTLYLPLTLMSPAEYEDAYASTATSIPAAWFAEGSTVYLLPTPNAAYTIQARYLRAEPDLSASTATTVMPGIFSSAIIAAALHLYYTTLQDPGRADMAQQEVDRWVRQMQRYQSQYAGGTRVKVRDWL